MYSPMVWLVFAHGLLQVLTTAAEKDSVYLIENM